MSKIMFGLVKMVQFDGQIVTVTTDSVEPDGGHQQQRNRFAVPEIGEISGNFVGTLLSDIV